MADRKWLRRIVLLVISAIGLAISAGLANSATPVPSPRPEPGSQPQSAPEPEPEPAAKDDIIRFTLERGFDGLSAPFLTAVEKGYYKAENLDVRVFAGTGSRESLSRVASGAYQFGFADINALIRFRDQNPGRDIKAIMMAYDIPPYAIIGRKSRGVSELADLQGKTLGAVPTDETYALWPAFVTVSRINAGKIGIEHHGFAQREPVLAQGRVDGILGDALVSVARMKSAGVPAEDISVILFGRNGLDLYGHGVIVNGEFARDHPDAVRGFVKATLRGYLDVVADPAIGIDSVLARNGEARGSVELERLQMAVNDHIATEWVKANGLGGVDMDRLQRSIGRLGLAYKYKTKVEAADIFTDIYLPPKADRMLR